MADIFLSHASTNKDKVRRIAELLIEEGYEVWWDGELPPHRSYTDVIQEEIGRAKVVLVAWSQEGVTSEWVRAEADIGRAGRKLVQVAVDSCQLPLPFNQIHVVSLTGWRGNRTDAEWQLILRSIAELVARPELPEPAGTDAPTAAPSQPRLRRRQRLLRSAFGIAATAMFGAAVGVMGARFWAIQHHPPRPPDYVIADSDKRILTSAEIKAMPVDKLRVARNELFARHGYIFKQGGDMRAYFCQLDWYLKAPKQDLVVPETQWNAAENTNLTMILGEECARNPSMALCPKGAVKPK
jgi:hypothetical protein